MGGDSGRGWESVCLGGDDGRWVERWEGVVGSRWKEREGVFGGRWWEWKVYEGVGGMIERVGG